MHSSNLALTEGGSLLRPVYIDCILARLLWLAIWIPFTDNGGLSIPLRRLRTYKPWNGLSWWTGHSPDASRTPSKFMSIAFLGTIRDGS